MQTDALTVITRVLSEAQIPYEVSPGAGTTVVAEVAGEAKLKIPIAFTVGRHSVAINCFVMRAPEEHVEQLYRWLLKRNRKLFAVSYAIDQLGDVYLVGRLPHAAITADTVDQIIGSVVATADGDFNVLLEMGFESSIRAEWKWRLSRGESTRNLLPFAHLAPRPDDTAG